LAITEPTASWVLSETDGNTVFTFNEADNSQHTITLLDVVGLSLYFDYYVF
jgi:hypothetical protein